MPSSYSTSLRFELQFTGENINTWGDRLNTVITRTDFAIAGWTNVPLTADYALTSSNTASDQARSAMLKFTGSPAASCIVTIPSVSKQYLAWNATAQVVTITTGAGAVIIMDPGDKITVFCDGTNVYELGFGGLGLKAFISSVAAGGTTGNVPSPIGNAGKWLTNNGTLPAWAYLTIADVTDYLTDQTSRRTTATALAVAFAVAL